MTSSDASFSQVVEPWTMKSVHTAHTASICGRMTRKALPIKKQIDSRNRDTFSRLERSGCSDLFMLCMVFQYKAGFKPPSTPKEVPSLRRFQKPVSCTQLDCRFNGSNPVRLIVHCEVFGISCWTLLPLPRKRWHSHSLLRTHRGPKWCLFAESVFTAISLLCLRHWHWLSYCVI